MDEIIRFLVNKHIDYTIQCGGTVKYVTLSFKLMGMEFITYIDNETTLDDFKSTINEDFKLKLINQRKYHLRMAESLGRSINKSYSLFE